MDREILESFKEVTNELWEFVRDESDDPSVGIIGWNESKAKVARAREAIAQLEASQREAPVVEGDDPLEGLLTRGDVIDFVNKGDHHDLWFRISEERGVIEKRVRARLAQRPSVTNVSREATTPADPRARVVEIARDLGIMPPASLFLADRLASAGLLASAPVVPSVEELEKLVREYRGDPRIANLIRNHLLTLGWREK